jgi:PleD family two-component response regulator
VHVAGIVHEDMTSGRLTVSIGAAAAERTEAGEIVLARADAALYAAKNGGRDRIATAEPATS